MPDSFIPYAADPATVGRRQATVKRSETRDGVTADFQRDEVIVTDRRVRTFRGTGSTFRTPGNAATPQNIWSIENAAAAGSGLVVSLRDLFIMSAQVTANATMPPWLTLFRTTTLPTGGITFTKVSKDTRDAASNAGVVIRQTVSADGGAATAITAAFVAPRLATRIASQLYTAVGVYQSEPQDMLVGIPDDELLLQPGQAYVLSVNTAAAADNIAGRSFWVDFGWTEFSEY